MCLVEFTVYEAIRNAIVHAEGVSALRILKGYRPTPAERVGYFVTSLRTHIARYDCPAGDVQKHELALARANLLQTRAWDDIGVLKRGYVVDYGTINRLANKARFDTMRGVDEFNQSMGEMRQAIQGMELLLNEVGRLNKSAEVVVSSLCAVAETLAPIGSAHE